MTDDFVEFRVRLVDEDLSPRQLESFALMLRHTIKQDVGDIVDKHDSLDAKGIDPTVAGILAITVLPTLLTKFLDFLHSWAMRRENQHVKVRIQLADDSSLDIEVPQTASPEEIKKWIEVVRQSLIKKTAASSKKR